MNILVPVPLVDCGPTESVLLGKFLGMELMDHEMCICLTVKPFSKAVGSIYIPTQSNSFFFFSFEAALV